MQPGPGAAKHEMARQRPTNKEAGSNDKADKSGGWLLALFALPFAAIGLGTLLLGVLPTLYDWSRMQGWQPVQARLVAAEAISSRGSKSTTYGVEAEYRYRVAGQEYTSHRVAINGGSDNVGDFQQSLGKRLEAAHRSGASVQAWVDPDNPADAVLDRSLRAGLLAFKMVFVLAFGGVGTGLLVVVWRTRRAKVVHEQMPPASADRPWEARPEWAGNQIRSHQKVEQWVAWGLAGFWNLISLPMAVAVVPDRLARGDYLVVAGASLFPLIGLFLLSWAIRATLNNRRYGDVRLALDPFPGSIGGHVGATLQVPVAHDPGLRFLVTLLCLQRHRTSSGGKSQSSERTVWQTQGLAQVQQAAQGVGLAFRFDVPAHLPATEEPSSQYHSWRLDVQSVEGSTGENRAPGFVRRFEVPVYITGEKSVWLRQDAAQHPQLGEVARTDTEDISDVEQVPGGVRLYFPYGRRWKLMLALLAFGAVFAGAGTLLWNSEAPLLFSALFGGIGWLVVLSALYGLGNSLTVHLDRQGLHTERRLLGLLSFKSEATASEIARLELKESYSTESGGQKDTYYRLQAVLTSGKSITVADSLRGKAAAGQLLSSLCRQTGYTKGSAPG